MADQASLQFKFKKHMTIGAISAEEDKEFLQECFVDTGDYEVVSDVYDQRSIVLGRVGAGKTALIERIKNNEENVLQINPEELSLSYIINSTILSFFESIGVKLDLFYQLLWRHILVVELVKTKFNIHYKGQEKNFFDRISSMVVKDRKREVAVNYLRKWEDKFWVETEVRVKEITTKFEKELEGSVGAAMAGVELNAKGLSALTKEIKEDICARAQGVVNKVQISELNQVLGLLSSEVFTDAQKKYYIVVDKLDDDWIDDEARCRLIRALIETIRAFRKIETVKIVIALRVDLLARVFDKTRDAGFQEEKYEDLMLKIRWNKDELKTLLDRRVGSLIKRKYTKSNASFSDVFAPYVGSDSASDFIIKRTLMRPREIIQYVNECIVYAQGKTQISAKNVRDAEISYSKKRLASVCQEWYADYPNLEKCFEIVKKRKDGFKRTEIEREHAEQLMLELLENEHTSDDPIYILARKLYEGSISWSSFINGIFRIMYRVGAIGVKKDGFSSAIWSYENEPDISEGEIKRSSHFYVHPMLWRVLGIHSDERKR